MQISIEAFAAFQAGKHIFPQAPKSVENIVPMRATALKRLARSEAKSSVRWRTVTSSTARVKMIHRQLLHSGR